jgi:monoterpene epsilon-lactone hydrolase
MMRNGVSQMSDEKTNTTIPARAIPVPAHLSAIAQAYLVPQQSISAYPPIEDKGAWLAYVNTQNEAILPMLAGFFGNVSAEVEILDIGGTDVLIITPEQMDPASRCIVLDIHGGGLILGGGEVCRIMGIGAAARTGHRTWAVDYRMPPEHLYPVALDDCMNAYRALLKIRLPAEIIVSGGSAGGNLAAALILRARDEGLPLPAAVILMTPEVDLTESGDSFQTNDGVDPALHSLMPVNVLYANGNDLKHPYLSPLFGDLHGFPPTLLTTGTRDLYLSNTVRMHRALRAANVNAQLHVTEAGPHTGFPGSPEGDEIDKEIRDFIKSALEPDIRSKYSLHGK